MRGHNKHVEFMLNGQPHVMSGDNLVHSVFLQTLSSWAVGLGIDNILYNVAQPLHLLDVEGRLLRIISCSCFRSVLSRQCFDTLGLVTGPASGL